MMNHRTFLAVPPTSPLPDHFPPSNKLCVASSGEVVFPSSRFFFVPNPGPLGWAVVDLWRNSHRGVGWPSEEGEGKKAGGVTAGREAD